MAFRAWKFLSSNTQQLWSLCELFIRNMRFWINALENIEYTFQYLSQYNRIQKYAKAKDYNTKLLGSKQYGYNNEQ